MHRRTLPICILIAWFVAAGRAAQAPQTTAPFALDEVTIAQLQEGLASGSYTSRRLAELYLNRIEQIDRGGPTLRSVIETNPEALAIADALDRRAEGEGSAEGRCTESRS